MSDPNPGSGGRGRGRRGGGKRGGRGRRPNRETGQSRSAVTTKQDAVLAVLLPPGYDKAKDNPLKIHSIGSNAAHRVNLSFVTLAVISREGGSPGTARAAYKLETGRRVRRIPIAKMDANPYRIPQTGMVAVGPKDY